MRPQRVLVIEDDAGVRRLLATTLELGGYAVAASDSALGAMALARRLRPAAIVLDLGLPYRSGTSLLADLKADPTTAPIPVVVVSALADTLTDARRALAAAVLPKPFSPLDLLATVQAARCLRAVIGPASSPRSASGPADEVVVHDRQIHPPLSR